MKSSYIDGFFVFHDEKRGFHEGKKTMATEIHSKFSKGDNER